MLSLGKERSRTGEVGTTKEFKVPHTLVIISFIMIIMAVLTWVLPGGAYERVVNDMGRTVVVDGSFSYIGQQPQGLFKVLQAPIKGIEAGAEIIAFLFIVSGAIAIITKTRAIDSGIARAVESFKGKELLIIPVLFGLFSLGGAVFGMTEEAIPFIAMLVPLCLALGYDSIMAMAISYVGCIVGFATAMINPFSVGIAAKYCTSSTRFRSFIPYTYFGLFSLPLLFYL